MNLNRMWLFSVLGILFLVMSGSVIYLSLENHSLKQAAAETHFLSEETERTESVSTERSPTEQQPERAKAVFVEGVFQQFLPYTEETYLSRFDAVADKLAPDVLDQLKGMIATIEPGITVQNTLHNLAIYTNGTDSNQFLVIATISLQIEEGIDSAYTQVYHVSVADEYPYQIDQVDSLGSIAPFELE